MSKSDRSETGILEKYRVSIKNTGEQPEISSTMAEYGYDATEMANGQALLDNATTAYASNKTEGDEKSEAHDVFIRNRKQLDGIFTKHRKAARIVLKNDQLTLSKLGVTGEKPGAYANWLETIRKFYSEATTDTEVQSKLVRLKVTPEELTSAQALIEVVGASRAAYLKEKGESQEATAIKDAALSEIDKWMSEFYAVARIAMEDKPQLLEALGIIVRS